MNAAPPPPYIHTVYDETIRGIWYPRLCIESMANCPNILGHLEFTTPGGDGSFAICAAAGLGNFISKVCVFFDAVHALRGMTPCMKALLDAIPEEKRPVLDETNAGRKIELPLTGGEIVTLGSVFFPFLLTDMDTGERMRYVLNAFVVPKLLIPMFIGTNWRSVIQAMRRSDTDFTFIFKCREGTCRVKGY